MLSGARLTVDFAAPASIGIGAHARAFQTVTSLAQEFAEVCYFDAAGVLPESLARYLANGGSTNVARDLRGKLACRPSSSKSYPEHTVGFHFAPSHRSRSNDVEIQFIATLDGCFAVDIDNARGDFKPIRLIQHCLEHSDLVIAPNLATRNELVEFFAADAATTLFAPVEPVKAAADFRAPPRFVMVVLTDPPTDGSYQLAARVGRYLQTAHPDIGLLLVWPAEYGKSTDRDLAQCFDLARPLARRERMLCMQAALAVVLVGVGSTNSDLIVEAGHSSSIVAPRQRGYERMSATQPIERYDADNVESLIKAVQVAMDSVHRSTSSSGSATGDFAVYMDDLKRAVLGIFGSPR